MIAKAIKEEHPRPRPLHLTVEHFFKGYPGLQHAGGQDRRRAGASRQRPPPAARRGAARARLPRGPQGHGEALQGPLQAAPLRPRRLRGGRHAGQGADRADRRRRRGGVHADLRARERPPAPDRAPVLPDHADVPALRAGRLPRLPARQVQDPLPRADPDRPVGRRAVARSRPRADRGGRHPGAHPGGADRHGRPRDAPCGSDDGEPRPRHRRLLLLGRPPRAGARARRAHRGDHRRQPRGPDLRAGAHGVRPRRHASTRCCAGSCRRRRSTR